MKSVDKKNAFTIVELLVAMALLVILLGLSGMVFSTTVKAHRTAGATIEITRNLRAITDQLNSDFQGLRKDGEIFLAWIARPAIDERGFLIDDNSDTIPDYYQKFDRIIFFADGDFQTYQPQAMTAAAGGGSKIVHGNLARISYVPAKNNAGIQASIQPDRKGRILARTEHVVTADSTLPDFPDWSAWDPVTFETGNYYTYEYQTTSMADWTNTSSPVSPYVAAKNDILTILSDVQNILAASTVTEGGPTVEIGDHTTYHNLFGNGVGEFAIQIWLEDEQRWFPQIDPNGDGVYTDTDYPLDGSVIHPTHVMGFLYVGSGESNLQTNTGRSLKFTALKFTFTLYDSNGIIPDGKTFTHIVYIDN